MKQSKHVRARKRHSSLTIRKYIFVVVVCYASSVLAQSESNANRSVRAELTIELSESKRADVYDRNAFDIERQKFFAITDKHRVISIDLGVLEKSGQVFTFSPIPGRKISIRSLGITRESTNGFHTGVFHGEIIPPGWENEDTSNFPVEWIVSTWSVGNDGVHILPARNHRRLKELMELQGEEGVYPEEAYMRKDERLVHGVTGEVKDFEQGGIFQLFPLRNNRDSMFVFEVDPERQWDRLSDDTGRVDEVSPEAIERRQRSDTYLHYVEELRRRFGGDDNADRGEPR